MSDFALAHAADGTAQTLAEKCAAQLPASEAHTLGFLYVTDALADDLDRIAEILKSRTPVKNWIGTVGLGICATGTEYFHRPAIVALTGRFNADEFRLIAPVGEVEEIAGPPGDGFVAALGVVHVDPRNPQAAELVEAFARKHGVYLVGGMTSADTTFAQIAGGVTEGGLSGVEIGGRRQVTFGLTQGCSPIGKPHRITEARSNVVVALDGRPALEVLYEEAAIEAGDDPRQGLANVYVALLVEGSNAGDYLVRHLIGIDPKNEVFAITDDVSEVRRVMFVRRDAANADDDLGRMLDGISERLSTPAKAGLYFSCVARGPQLFGEPSHELKAIRERFGDIPIAGFYGSAEVCDDRVYAYTGVLTLFQ